MERLDPEKLGTHVTWEKTLGLQQFPPHGESYQVWPDTGRLYLSGIRCMSEDDALVLTIRHPKTRDPIPGLERVPSASLNPYDSACHRFLPSPLGPRTVTADPGQLWLWLAVRHDPQNLEPMYCEQGLPLVIDVEGDAPLHLAFWGSDHYRVWGMEGNCPQTSDELRGPFDPTTAMLAPAMGVAPEKLN